jgi:hypothetical protein
MERVAYLAGKEEALVIESDDEADREVNEDILEAQKGTIGVVSY